MRFITVCVATALWALKVQAQSWEDEGVEVVCDMDTEDPAGVVYSRANAQYLSNIDTGEQPINGPGPDNCGQVACNWGSIIEWCNDNEEELQLDNFTVIAEAFTLMNSKLTSMADDDCVRLGPPGLLVAGEVRHPDGFRVRIRGGENC